MTGGMEPENIKSLVLHGVINLILLPFVAPQWSHFYSFQGLMGLCGENAMVLTSAR